MLVCTLYDVTHWVVSSARPCVTTLLTVYAEPSAIVMYWPTAFVSADHAWAESSIERAKPVPGASLFQTLEYDRALSAGLNDTPAKAGAYTYAMGESREPTGETALCGPFDCMGVMRTCRLRRAWDAN